MTYDERVDAMAEARDIVNRSRAGIIIYLDISNNVYGRMYGSAADVEQIRKTRRNQIKMSWIGEEEDVKA